jgi:hypothetical protein
MEMSEENKKEIAKIVAAIFIKKYKDDFGKDINPLISLSLEAIREQIRKEKDEFETYALAKFKKRFHDEVEPMLDRFSDRLVGLMRAADFEANTFETVARQELARVIREKAEEWARKVATSEVKFKFDDVFEDY